MHSNAICLQVFFYHVGVEKCYFVYQNPVEIVVSPPHYITWPLCTVVYEELTFFTFWTIYLARNIWKRCPKNYSHTTKTFENSNADKKVILRAFLCFCMALECNAFKKENFRGTILTCKLHALQCRSSRSSVHLCSMKQEIWY